ncbi:aldo/keto reductase [Rubellimicrobium rubrum]|uniref:Aldo/keto reductase n=1 Tax=Rubellimicrobium rubrum TaxID=2585369 RepID=A0A5C4MZF5_9RHOB|nr:aldo/keto reductase [Rubellimicrobium rubrum]TNC51653.1 aldo/keto reductase [Rubellimicrobium rubrum]
MDLPRLGFGTYGRTGPEGRDAILAALEIGYRHLDTAQTYDTEREVGEAVRLSGLPRDEVFVTTKVSEGNLGEGQVIPSLERSLEASGLDHVDLALIHWPARKGGPAPEVYLRQLSEAKARGLARQIGVSNFTIALIEEARSILGDGVILTNQVELNPWFRNRKLADHCMSRGIVVTCYEPLARGKVGADPVLQRIAARHRATPEQVALAWELAQGYAVIPTSRNPDRIAQNFAAQDLALSSDELAEIDTLDRGIRSIDPDWGPVWD